MSKIITTLSRTMGEKRITQAELSRLTGIRAATIKEYYNGIWRSIKKVHIEKICEALKCNIDDIFMLKK